MRGPVNIRPRVLRSAEESGGVAIIVVMLLFFVLLGFAALSVDGGSLRAEERELQNAADAAALAVAQDCAVAPGTPGGAEDCSGHYGDGLATASEFAGLNTTLEAVETDVMVGPENKPSLVSAFGLNIVTVLTNSTKDLAFAPAPPIEKQSAPVGARATALWESRSVGSAAPSVPITIAECEWQEATGATGSPDDPPPTLPSDESVLFFHSGTAGSSNNQVPCANQQAGQDMAGGFGWLEPSEDSGDPCSSAIVNTGEALFGTANEGNGMKTVCADTLQGSIDNQTVLLIPIYEKVLCSDGTETCSPGQEDQYQISGFGAILLTGFYFDGGQHQDDAGVGQDRCKGPNRVEDAPVAASCLVGNFVAFVAPADFLDDEGEDRQNYGSRIVYLVD